MFSRSHAYLYRFCAWFCVTFWYLPFLVQFAERVLVEAAWNDGFLAACFDLKFNQACMLECLSRYKIERSKAFHPCIPNLCLINEDTAHEWNMGYERAIMLFRLDYEPVRAFASKLPLATYGLLPCSFDAQIRCVLDGELKDEPRTWRTVKGQHLVALEYLESLLRCEYETYATRIQQIRGHSSADVSKDLEKL